MKRTLVIPALLLLVASATAQTTPVRIILSISSGRTWRESMTSSNVCRFKRAYCRREQEILPHSRFALMMLGDKFFQKLGHSVLYFSR
jgi:hypothetical protein